MLVDIDPCPTEKMQLLVKLLKVGPSLMVDHGFRDQADFEASRLNADAILDVFTKTGKLETSLLFPDLSGYPHVEAPGVKYTDMSSITPDTSRSKRRSHGVTDSLLNRAEGIMSSIRPT